MTSARLAEEQRQVNEAKATAARAAEPDAPFELKVGAMVRHAGLDRDVEVLELDGGRARIHLPI